MGKKKCLFAAYTIFIVWYTMLKREPRSFERVFKPELFWAVREWIVNPTVESKKEAVQYLLNVLFFIPYGLLFPWKDNWKRVLVTALVLSVLIEISQFIFNLGWCEVDDVISNTLGAMIGWGVMWKVNKRKKLIVEVVRMEKYSVLMSLYVKEDAENFRIAINSMINQSCPPDEIVLVEDGKLTDELYAVIEREKNNHPNLITSVVHEKNLGLGLALQHGLEVARNELVVRMDTDDIAVLDRCEKQLNFMNIHPDIAIVGGQIEEFIGEVTNVVGKREVPTSDSELKEFLKKRCPFNHMTVMFRKSDILEVGNYQEWFWNEDYYLWIRLVLADKIFANLPETLVMVRTGTDMYQRRGGKKYFVSEKDIQKLMLKNRMIGYPRYLINVIERLVLQVLMPNWLRGIVFRTFARK